MTTSRPVPLVRRFYRDLADGTAGRIEEKAQAAVVGVEVLAVDAGELREAWLEDLACAAGYVLSIPIMLSEASTSRAEDAWVWVATAEAGLALRSALQAEERWRMIAADEVQPYRASALVCFEPFVASTAPRSRGTLLGPGAGGGPGALEPAADGRRSGRRAGGRGGRSGAVWRGGLEPARR